jgi:hypothetical protein
MSRERERSLRQLAEATTAEELDAAAGYLGVVLRPEKGAGGEWIAVRYRDSHVLPGAFSVAIARCSDGEWLESHEHYCGKFAAYRRLLKLREEFLNAARSEDERRAEAGAFERDYAGSLGELRQIELNMDLAGAKAALRKMGFWSRRSP